MALELRTHKLASERCAEVIEFAIVLPFLLLVVFGIVDFGFMFQRYVVLTNAAMEGARLASLPGYEDPANARERVFAYAADSGIPDVTGTGSPCRGTAPLCAYVVDVDIPSDDPDEPWLGKEVTVTYVYNYSYIGPIAGLFGGSFSSVTLNTRSTMRSQLGPS